MNRVCGIIVFGTLFFGGLLTMVQGQSVQNIVTNDDERIVSLRNFARTALEALDKGEFEKFADLTYPVVVEKVGRKTIISMMKQVMDENAKVFETFALRMSEPGTITAIDDQLFGVVPFRLEGTTFEQHKVVTYSCMVGVSNNKGKNWTFVSCEKFDAVFRNARGKVTIPKERMTVDGIEQ